MILNRVRICLCLTAVLAYGTSYGDAMSQLLQRAHQKSGFTRSAEVPKTSARCNTSFAGRWHGVCHFDYGQPDAIDDLEIDQIGCSVTFKGKAYAHDFNTSAIGSYSWNEGLTYEHVETSVVWDDTKTELHWASSGFLALNLDDSTAAPAVASGTRRGLRDVYSAVLRLTDGGNRLQSRGQDDTTTFPDDLRATTVMNCEYRKQ